MHQGLLWLWDVDQGIALAGYLPHACTQQNQQICVFNGALQARVSAQAEQADIVRIAVIKQILPPEGAGHRQTRGMDKPAHYVHCLRIPSTAAQH